VTVACRRGTALVQLVYFAFRCSRGADSDHHGALAHQVHIVRSSFVPFIGLVDVAEAAEVEPESDGAATRAMGSQAASVSRSTSSRASGVSHVFPLLADVLVPV
jgi:hypothetical protein